MERYLTILEVSQKQAYIFKSNRLRENVNRSEQIARVTSADYFTDHCPGLFDIDKNLVYSGGGHIVLQFDKQDDALDFNKIITRAILEEYPEMDTFVVAMKYDDKITPYENLRMLKSKLENKKSVRRSVFKKGSYGIELIDSDTRQPRKLKSESNDRIGSIIDGDFIPEGFKPVYELSELGENFVAVVHIDGNGMGKRVNSFQMEKGGPGVEWDQFAKDIRDFSQDVDKEFKGAFKRMNERVARKFHPDSQPSQELEETVFPVRRIITSGDDICFVSAGSIGIECARIFIEELEKYNACAGVAIVHSKYPFFRAYELAEQLCSNAKSIGAALSTKDNGASISSIDWHIEYGEMGDDLSSIRSVYQNEEGYDLNMRPYIIKCPDEIKDKEPLRQYENFKRVEAILSDKKEGYARGSVKQLRSVLRKKESDAWYFLKYHKIDRLAMECYQGVYKKVEIDRAFSGEQLEKKLFVKTADGKIRSTLFDAIEIMDEFVDLA